MSIYDHIKHTRDMKRYDGEIGLEIETESLKEYLVPEFKYWSVHNDGSLRNFGKEYVLRQPVKFDKEFNLSLEEFENKTKNINFVKDSFSTSVHVHLNMLNETFKTMGNFLTAYALTENLLIRFSGPDRLSNLFCLPICDAEVTYKQICNMMSHVASKNYKSMFYSESNNKYGALNLASFGTYGSLEIRSYRGTTDVKEIHNWVSILYSILQYSRNDITPKDIMDQWKIKELNLLDDIFGKHRKDIKHKDEKQLLNKNLLYAASIAYSVKDWSSLDFDKKDFVFKPTSKQLDSESLGYFGKEFKELSPGEADFIFERMKERALQKHLLNPPKKDTLGPIPWDNIGQEDAAPREAGIEIRNRIDNIRLANVVFDEGPNPVIREVEGDF